MKQSPVKLWRRNKLHPSAFGKTGVILSFTIIRVPPGAFTKYFYYPVIIVKMDDGSNRIGQLVDCEEKDVKIGRKVKTVLRRSRLEDHEDVISYCIKFILA